MHAGTAFEDLDDYLAVGRVTDLALSPDGLRLVVVRAALSGDAATYVNSLWEIDPAGLIPARRLTFATASVEDASTPVFTCDADLLFLSARQSGDEKDPPKALWCLPAGGGEARKVTDFAADVQDVRAASAQPRVLLRTTLIGGAESQAHDRAIRQDRKDRKVTAILHRGYPVRHWDRDLGPEQPHLYVGTIDSLTGQLAYGLDEVSALAGVALREAETDLSADGSCAVTTWEFSGPGTTVRTALVQIDTDTGERSILVDDQDADLALPTLSPDGSAIAYVRRSHSTETDAPQTTLHVRERAGITSELFDVDELWPTSICWSPDGSGLFFTADHQGRGPIFLVRRGQPPEQVTDDDAAYTNLAISPDGVTGFALRSSYRMPPHPVRIDLDTGVVETLLAPDTLLELPGTLTEVHAEADDGTDLRAWLALPTGAQAHAPVPLLLWVHGGPLSSWNTWSWRWNPWLLVAQGYAVLLPDPALSTGYGQEFISRGWGRWGSEPFTDLMAITDAAVARPDIDGSRTGVMGGSFGGYMANWMAGHTRRFSAVVTHASLWALDQFGPTTDCAWYWQREMTPEMAVENSPHLYVADIATPMLVIHGDRDYRVPIGEALRLWFELLSESGLPADEQGQSPHRFLYFPDEGHWVLAPQNAKLWYEVVRAFLSEHVLDEPVELPEILS